MGELLSQILLHPGCLHQLHLPLVLHEEVLFDLRLVLVLLLHLVVDFDVLAREVVTQVVLVALRDLEVDNFIPENTAIVTFRLNDSTRDHTPVVVIIHSVLYRNKIAFLFQFCRLHRSSENGAIVEIVLFTSIEGLPRYRQGFFAIFV